MKIKRLTLSGYKSIHPEGQTIEFGDITVLLGANGAGKSNLISFFTMLNSMMSRNLQRFIAEQGYASSLLYYGYKNTPQISAEISFIDEISEKSYLLDLSYAAGDILIFTNESIKGKVHSAIDYKTFILGVGQKESALAEKYAFDENSFHYFIYILLSNCRVFHFHDTSSAARIRNQIYIEDNRYLRADAGNLAAFLYAIQQNSEKRKYYDRIVRTIQSVMPNFKDFDLYPSENEKYILLNWRDQQSDYLFGPHQISDGGLRFIALTALLLQPPERLPKVIIIDEPELGLHPLAISVLSGMIKSASIHSQIILATQSTRMVDEFDLEQIVAVEYDKSSRKSLFKRLDENALSAWLENYSLSELWEKNIIGGRP